MSPAGVLSAVRERLLAGEANVVACPVPRGRALALAGASTRQTTVFWEEDAASGANAITIVGLEAAALLRASGEDRFEVMMEAQARVFASLRMPPELNELVRFFGGSAFSTGRDGSGCWEDFGDSTFLLPRVLYVDRPSGALLLVVDAPGAIGGTERSLAVFAAALEAMDHTERSALARPQIEAMRESAGKAEFEALVQAAQGRIAEGNVDKVALARRVTLTLSVAPRVEDLLERLQTSAHGATRFAFGIGERTFVGATPECLVKRRGLVVETEALAGTAAKRAGQTREDLLGSPKDLDEHRYVVEAIRTTLAPVCSRLDVASEATIKELPQLLHLCTPITGQLARPLHVLELVSLLHPTPAVCGSPREQAFRFIVEHETAPRGWYAAPFGWTNAAGDGHFVVGLRSALLHGRNVHLYAGAGIVRASQPALEYDETELKLESIRSALGLGDVTRGPAPPV